MASLLLILALVLGIAGGFLLYYDRTQRAADAQHSTDAQGSADVQGSADADTPPDTDSQHGPDTQQRDAAAGGSDNSAAEQSQGGKPQHSREDQDVPSHAVTEPGENAEDPARTEGPAEPEGEDGTETDSGTPSGFAAKHSPSPDIESDSSSATSSGRHHRTRDDADRRVSDKADDTRTSESAVLSSNDAVKGTATTSTTNAAHVSDADSADNADSVDSASVGSADRTGRAHAAGNTEKPAEAGLDSASDSSSASGADSGANNDAGLDAEAEAESELGADASREEAGHEETEDQQESHAKPKPVGRPRPLIPGTIRRERKNWAETRGFEYMKSDQYLVDEWTRGVASSGAAPKDIVAGNVYGHEMLLMDIDGVNVMAMRTGAASDVVIDFQRFDSQEAEMSEDLLLAMNIEGFDVYSSDRGVTERMVDERVRIALQRMPEVVSALWLETEWVLAQTTKHSRTADWEAMLPPLALLADASRVLPPRSSSVHTIHFEDLDPAREIPAPPVVEAVGGTASVGKPEFSRPVIQRPEEPLDMPSRTYSETRGPVEHTAIGADEVDAIADGNERPIPDSGTARLPRQQFGEASIFDDASDDAFGDDLGDAAKDSSTGSTRNSSRGSSQDASGTAAAREKEDTDRYDDSGSQQGE